MWLRRCHLATGVSVGSAHSIATSVLNLYPYRIKILHHLKWTDFDKRIKLAEWFLEDPIIARFFTPTHEAYFHLDHNVNNYNFRILSQNNPDVVVKNNSNYLRYMFGVRSRRIRSLVISFSTQKLTERAI